MYCSKLCDEISYYPAPSHPPRESSLCPAYPAHWSLGNHLGYQIDCCCIASVQVSLFLLNNGFKEEEEWHWQIRNSLTVLNLWKLSQSFLYVVCVYRDEHSLYRHGSFYCTSLYCASKTVCFLFVFTNCKLVATLHQGNLSAPFLQHLSLYHILVVLTIFPSDSLLLYLSWWSVTTDLWCYYCKLYRSTANDTQRT